MAPAYANLFMHDLESQLLDLAPVKPYLWLMYIDDIFMTWTAGEQLLLEFLQWINRLHIKFTWDWSKRNINYLDVQVINNNGVIETDLYTKPTDHDKNQYTCSTLLVIQRGLNKVSHMHRPLGSDAFVPRLLCLRTGQLIFKSI